MDLEEGVMDGKIQGFQNAIMPIRRELLTLRSYYDEIMDMGKQLEENENGFFAKKQVKYFGVISDRAVSDRNINDFLPAYTHHQLVWNEFP